MGKYASKGTTIEVSIATVFTTIANVTDLTFPDGTVETWQSTCLDTVGPSHTYAVSGYVDEGDWSATAFYDPSEVTHDYMESLRQLTPEAGSDPPRYERDFRIVLPTLGTLVLGSWAFASILTKWTPKASVGEPLTVDMGGKVTGNITYPAVATS